ncbi:hypothetical protein PQ610_02035 [Tardisphaera miroshnichenkoae]
MKGLNVYLPDHVRQALGGKGKLSEALVKLLEELADSGDSSLLPEEKKMLAEASQRYHVSLKVSRELMQKLRERANREGVKDSQLASALLMNRALWKKSARIAHAAYFPRGEEVQKFVEDGDKSHLRAVSSAEGPRPSNLALLGSAALDFLSSLGYSDEIKRAPSLSPEEAEKAIRSLFEGIGEAVERGKSYDEVKAQLELLRAEAENARRRQKELGDRVRSLADQLQKEGEAGKKEAQERIADLSRKLGEREQQITGLERQITQLKGDLESSKKVESDYVARNQSLSESLSSATSSLSDANEELKRLRSELQQTSEGCNKLKKDYLDALDDAKKMKEDYEARIESCEKARQSGELLAENRGWAVAPLSIALSVAAKNADALKLSWDAKFAIEDAPLIFIKDQQLKLPENLTSLQLPKGLDPRYALAYWTGMVNYGSAKFVADTAAIAAESLLAMPASLGPDEMNKRLKIVTDAVRATANDFFSNAWKQLLDAYWDEKEMANLNADEISKDVDSFLKAVTEVREKTEQSIENLDKVLELAAIGKRASSLLGRGLSSL